MEPKYTSKVREVRKRRGLKTKDLAEAIGVVPNYISRIEYGTEACGELMARRIGEYFGLAWKQFLSEKYRHQ
jgi:transcriptional regulator with XRE-family HTH domain